MVSKASSHGSVLPLELWDGASRPLGYVVSKVGLAGSTTELVSTILQPLGYVVDQVLLNGPVPPLELLRSTWQPLSTGRIMAKHLLLSSIMCYAPIGAWGGVDVRAGRGMLAAC